MSGPRLLRTQGPRLLDTQGPRLLKTEGPRLLRTAEGPRLLKTQARNMHTEGPRLLRTQGPRLLKTEGPRLLKTQGPRLLKTQTRSLHETGATSSSSLLTSDKPTFGSLSPKLPSSEAAAWKHETGNALRHFNTSRSLKAVNDSSTIDFMYIPDFDPDMKAAPTKINVPIILSTPTSSATRAAVAEEADQPVMQPTIYTAAADSTHIHAPSAMADMTESNHIDFQGMASKVTKNLQKPVEEAEGMARQIWNDFLEDVFGPKHSSATKV
ncbi:hypothetical protein E8E13_010317 [Curvularia kusanoi]|uniref:Uncharacterized protein n=1 Tax=Curvularia kusanoi TaxID=90978 RepID=A0A9P4TJF1_CURKU|nr:hypothetical protein E8E13_010317 [Curvularia kusanoi]